MKTKLAVSSALLMSVSFAGYAQELRPPSQPTALPSVSFTASSPVPSYATIIDTPRSGAASGSQVQPAPGLYTAEPYTMLVYVPRLIDPGIVIERRDSSPRARIMEPQLRITKPELRLIPRR
jgi:hypothetical protein